MSEQAMRSLFAVLGLAVVMGLMVFMGRGGLIWGFVYGAGGAVLGGMLGETLARRGGRS
jgi:hypothetical protein